MLEFVHCWVQLCFSDDDGMTFACGIDDIASYVPLPNTHKFYIALDDCGLCHDYSSYSSAYYDFVAVSVSWQWQSQQTDISDNF